MRHAVAIRNARFRLAGWHPLAPFFCLYVTFGATLGFLSGGAPLILDYVARELGEPETLARPEVATCLGWCGAPACSLSPLARSLCDRRRRTCCLRQRLPGVASCGESCPLKNDGRCCGAVDA